MKLIIPGVWSKMWLEPHGLHAKCEFFDTFPRPTELSEKHQSPQAIPVHTKVWEFPGMTHTVDVGKKAEESGKVSRS